MGTTSNIRTALANGDMDGFLAAIEPDRAEGFGILAPDGTYQTITMAQVGRTIIMTDPLTGQHTIAVHHHGAGQDEECWQRNVADVRAAVNAFNDSVRAAAERFRDNPMAQHMATLLAGNGVNPDRLQVPATPPEHAEPVPHTGMYL